MRKAKGVQTNLHFLQAFSFFVGLTKIFHYSEKSLIRLKTLFSVYPKKIPPSREIIFRQGGYIFNQRLSLFNISQLPAQRTGSQHSSIRVFQFGHHQFGLALVNHQDIVINSFLDRLEDVISGLSQPTEQNNCFGTGESNEVCNSLSQNSTGKVKISCASLSP